MIKRYLTWVLFVVLIATLGCSKSDVKLANAELPADYTEQLNAFYTDRHESLTKSAGWMRIDGMFWLDQGTNRFGSDASVSIVFPENKIPGNAGVFVVSGDSVWIRADKDIYFEHSDSLVTELLMYPNEHEVSMRYGDLEWIIIKRGDLIGIRLFNADNPLVDTFEGFPRFDINKMYNPPCAYSAFTTCQLPPIQNRLNVSILAGENGPNPNSALKLFITSYHNFDNYELINGM